MKKIITIVISILIVLGIMVVGLISILDDEPKISGDSLQFKEEYELLNGKYYEEYDIVATSVEIERDNPFIYVSDNDILDKLSNNTHIIYFGYPECGWSRRVVPVLTSFAKKNKINTIYYYNFSSLITEYEKGNNNKVNLYSSIIDILGDYIDTTFEDGTKKLSSPTVFFIKDGEIIGNHYKLVENYTNYNVDLTNEQTEELINIYQSYYDKMFANICVAEDC